MADPKQIEQEIREFLDKADNIRRADHIKYLMAIVNKHFELDKIEHIVTHYDFELMLSNSKSAWVQTAMPMEISTKKVEGIEANYILMMEAFVGYLNRMGLLKRLVKFDHRRRTLK